MTVPDQPPHAAGSTRSPSHARAQIRDAAHAARRRVARVRRGGAGWSIAAPLIERPAAQKTLRVAMRSSPTRSWCTSTRPRSSASAE